MDPRKRKVVSALVLVAVVLVYLIATAASQTRMYYLTVEEALARGGSSADQWVRVSGKVPGDSIHWQARDFQLTFDVTENGQRMPAVYRGVRPNNLIDGVDVVLEGAMNADGVFEVDRLLVQCPSKYKAADGDDYDESRYEEIDGESYEAYESNRPGTR